jgi:hypothetical protein
MRLQGLGSEAGVDDAPHVVVSARRPAVPQQEPGSVRRAGKDDLTVSLLQARLIELNLPIDVEVYDSLGDSA